MVFPNNGAVDIVTHMENELGQPVGPAVFAWRPAAPPPHTPMRGAHVTLEPLELARHGDDLWGAFGLTADGPGGPDSGTYSAGEHEARARAWTYLPVGPFERRGDFDAAMGAVAALEGSLFFTAVVGGTAVGFLSLMSLAPAVGSAEVGYVAFSPALQRSAASTEALFLAMRRALGEGLGYRRLVWKCDALNARSAAAAHRLGFTYEGTFRQCTVYKGRSRDTAWFSLLDAEWPAVEDAFDQYLAAGNFDASGAQRRPLRECMSESRAAAAAGAAATMASPAAPPPDNEGDEKVDAEGKVEGSVRTGDVGSVVGSDSARSTSFPVKTKP